MASAWWHSQVTSTQVLTKVQPIVNIVEWDKTIPFIQMREKYLVNQGQILACWLENDNVIALLTQQSQVFETCKTEACSFVDKKIVTQNYRLSHSSLNEGWQKITGMWTEKGCWQTSLSLLRVPVALKPLQPSAGPMMSMPWLPA